ncbi:unnamed protein product [Rhodiola kirilowii]
MKTKTKAPAKATNNNDDDDWAVAAMARDSLVVDLLLRLKHQASRPWAGKLVADLAPAGWGVKQPRSGSKSVGLVSECHRKSKERIGRRCSPSTPLSWSGGSGGGGGGMDGCETSSLPANRSPSSRSKISLTGSEVNGASSSKSKKKKTYAELKEEEDLLIKERTHLHHELAMLGATVKEQRAENENLKRIKLNLSTQLLKNNPHTAAGIGEPPNVALSMKAVMRAEGHDCASSALIPFGRPDVIPAQKRAHLMLPDLNMLPSEMDSTN